MDFNELKTFCIKNNIPIIRDETFKFIKNKILENNYSSILEIGTAYGYSSLLFSKIDCVKKIITIEKNESNYAIAKQIENDKITFLLADAFTFECKEKFDLIFLDACKSNQEILVNKYLNNLNEKGLMVIDNIFLKKFANQQNLDRQKTRLIQKVHQFHNWLLQQKKFNVQIIDLDDGIALITKN